MSKSSRLDISSPSLGFSVSKPIHNIINIDFARSKSTPASSPVPKGAVPQSRRITFKTSKATGEPALLADKEQIIAAPTNIPRKEHKEERKVTLSKSDVANWAGGEAEYMTAMERLRKAKLWAGSFESRKNLRLVRLFSRIRADKSTRKVSEPDTYVRITLQDFVWWVQSGPDLGASIVWNKESHGPNRDVGYKKAQLEHFVDCAVVDRYDKQSLLDYEELARKKGAVAWSGPLVESIVDKAWELQRSGSMENLDRDATILDRPAILKARNTILGVEEPVLENLGKDGLGDWPSDPKPVATHVVSLKRKKNEASQQDSTSKKSKKHH